MNQINTIEELLAFLDKEIIRNKLAKNELLNKYYEDSIIDKIILQLKNGKVSDISVSDLEKVLENFGPEEYDFFLEFKNVLDKYEMSEFLPKSALPDNKGFDIFKDNAIQYILTFVSHLKETLINEGKEGKLAEYLDLISRKIFIQKDRKSLDEYNRKLEEIKRELENKGTEVEIIDPFRKTLIKILKFQQL